MIHKSEIENYKGTLEELVTEIGDLRYDALSKFLNLLSEKIRSDGEKDRMRGRVKLARHLEECSKKLKDCEASIDNAWLISEPYMK